MRERRKVGRRDRETKGTMLISWFLSEHFKTYSPVFDYCYVSVSLHNEIFLSYESGSNKSEDLMQGSASE